MTILTLLLGIYTPTVMLMTILYQFIVNLYIALGLAKIRRTLRVFVLCVPCGATQDSITIHGDRFQLHDFQFPNSCSGLIMKI